MNEVILEMKDIDKRFSGVHALKSANLELRRGEVHALMGENGAGKSTLMKVLCGIHKPDGGSIKLFGEEVHFRGISDSKAAGISIIHQELNMMNHLTVARNIYIGREPMKGFAINDKKMIEKAGLGIAMKGSTPIVTEIANIVTEESNDSDGVAKALKRIIID